MRPNPLVQQFFTQAGYAEDAKESDVSASQVSFPLVLVMTSPNMCRLVICSRVCLLGGPSWFCPAGQKRVFNPQTPKPKAPQTPQKKPNQAKPPPKPPKPPQPPQPPRHPQTPRPSQLQKDFDGVPRNCSNMLGFVAMGIPTFVAGAKH